MHSPATEKLEDEIASAVRFDGRIMISGEPGTGRKFLARLIHERSRRGAAPFVVSNRRDPVGLTPEPSSDSESVHPFPKELFTAAQNGTLVIDGVDEISGPMQQHLLRFLERATNGGPRIMTTAGVDVFECVRSNRFASDLFYRLNIIRLLIPALRNRPDDIPTLFQHYLSRTAEGAGLRLSPGARQRLVEYAWPGNIQELKAVAEGVSRDDLRRQVEPHDLPLHIQ